MNIFTIPVSAVLLAAAGPALAQEAEGATSPATPAHAATPADPATPVDPTVEPAGHAGHASYTDAQIDSYAKATLAIRELQLDSSLDDATVQARAATIVTESGLDAETFNAIVAAQASDPALADRVQLAMDQQRGAPQG